MQYFSFDSVLIGKKTKNTLWEKIIDWLLNHFMPMANPTLDKNLDYVKEWYIEYDDVEEYTNREVGVAENGLVVFKAPFEENWGYWGSGAEVRGWPTRHVNRRSSSYGT